MKNSIKTLLISVALLSGPAVLAAPACHSVFTHEKSAKSTDVSFDANIPKQTQKWILEAIADAKAIADNLDLPKKFSVSLNEDPTAVGAATEYLTDNILVTRSFLALPENLAKAVIAHEYTHMIVTRSFVAPGSPKSLRENLIEHQDDQFMGIMLVDSHTSYAELLCDLMPTLITRDSKIFPKFIDETRAFIEKTPDLTQYLDRLVMDKPYELSVRDFSISDTDPRWATYNPKDGHYNRFNQLRAHLWNRWIKDLPREKSSQFFKSVLEFLRRVHAQGHLDMLRDSEGIAESNRQLIEALDQHLSSELN